MSFTNIAGQVATNALASKLTSNPSVQETVDATNYVYNTSTFTYLWLATLMFCIYSFIENYKKQLSQAGVMIVMCVWITILLLMTFIKYVFGTNMLPSYMVTLMIFMMMSLCASSALIFIVY